MVKRPEEQHSVHAASGPIQGSSIAYEGAGQWLLGLNLGGVPSLLDV
jgi:hypothetical protein